MAAVDEFSSALPAAWTFLAGCLWFFFSCLQIPALLTLSGACRE